VAKEMKFLFLSALLIFAADGASQAQVYSVNAVGYVNVLIRPGFNLVANPLIAEDNSIGGLFKNIQAGVPGGTAVYKFTDGQFINATWDDLESKFVPEAAAAEITLPGDGVFLFLPSPSDEVLTFVGEVPQGDVCTQIPHGFSIKSNPVPQTMSLSHPAASFPASPGDVIYVLNNTTGSFNVYQYDELGTGWVPNLPVIEVGHAFFLYHPGPATTWCRTFFINNPN
jgi:hypothetical protein